MSYATILGFKNTFPIINWGVMKKNEKVYDIEILHLYLLNVKKGYKVKKIWKTTKKGTSVTYTAFKNQKEIGEYFEEFNKRVNEFNSKWNENFPLLDLKKEIGH